MSSSAVSSTSNKFSCIPYTPGQKVNMGFAMILIAASAITTLIFMKDASLNSIFYTAYGALCGFGVFLLAAGAITMCKKSASVVPHSRTT